MDFINKYIGGMGNVGRILSPLKSDLKNIAKKKENESMNSQIDYKNLSGIVRNCITPRYLSGAGKPGESMKQNAKFMGLVGNGTSYAIKN